MKMCPCCSGKGYKKCCKPYHEGELPPTPEALMRSRYSAYAKGNVRYIVETTHPDNPHYKSDFSVWEEELRAFCEATTFRGLEVLESSQEGDRGVAVFFARLSQGGADASFSERSRFRRVNGRWLYLDGEVA